MEKNYTNYDVACSLLGVDPLESRRERFCIRFANKDFKSPRKLLTKTTKLANRRAKPLKVKEFKCRTARFEKSPLPYLSKLLNQ